MDMDEIRQECLELIDQIFEAGEDVAWPVSGGTRQVMLCGGADGYALSTDLGRKNYPDAEAVLNALIEVERVSGAEDPLGSVHESLKAIA